MKNTSQIDYKKLRRISPQVARVAVLNDLHTNKRNIAKTAKAFGVQRTVIYDIIKKQKEKDLHDRSKAPKIVKNRTNDIIVQKVIAAEKATGFGPRRLFNYLQLRYGLYVAYGTIRSILQRNKEKTAS